MLKAHIENIASFGGLQENLNNFLSKWQQEHGSNKQIAYITAHTGGIPSDTVVYTFFYLDKTE